MKKRRYEWHYVNNQFDTATARSNKRMNSLLFDHVGKLDAEKEDPEIQLLWSTTKPVQEEYFNEYTNYIMALSYQQGATQRVEEMIAELMSAKIAAWDNVIKVKLGEGTAEYTSILPNGRKPFQGGTIDLRIAEVEGLIKKLAGFPELAPLKVKVEEFFTALSGARLTQQLNEEAVERYSDRLEVSRKKTAMFMHRNLGFLLYKYYTNPGEVSKFYDISLIRRTGADEEPITPVEPGSGNLVFISNQTTPSFVNVSLKGAAGKQITITWGADGSEEVILNGNIQDFRHDFTEPGVYTIKLSGDTDSLESIASVSSSLTTVVIPETMSACKVYDFMRNKLTETSVNNLLIAIDDFGSENGIVKLTGLTNATPTGEGADAMESLIERGWTVETN